MGIEQFAPARDFFYLAAAFMGAGIGCILNRFRRQTSSRFRDSCVTVALCFFSLAVAALTVTVIYSNWMIFSERSLYLPAGILTAIIILCFRFPRAAGFPCLLAAGVIAVWVGYTCQRFPIIEDLNIVQINREETGLVDLRTFSISFQPDREDSSLEFHSRFLSFSRNFPLVGGVNRGLITEILEDGTLLYSNPSDANSFFSGVFDSFFSFREVSAQMNLGELPPGKAKTVLFDGSSLVFR